MKRPADDFAALCADNMPSSRVLVDFGVAACSLVVERPCRSGVLGKDCPGVDKTSDMRDIRRKVDCRSGRNFVARVSSNPRIVGDSLGRLDRFISDMELRVLVEAPNPAPSAISMFCGNGGTGGIGEPRPESGVTTISPPLIRLSFQ